MTDRHQYLTSLLTSSLCVPISEHNGEIQPLSFDTSSGGIWLAFSSALKMSVFFEESVEFTEIAPQAMLRMSKEAGKTLGFDLGQNYGVLLDADALTQLDAYIAQREGVEDINAFEWKKWAHDERKIAAIEAILPAGVQSWLGLDDAQGFVLILRTNSSEFGFEEIGELRRQVLSLMEFDKISLAFLPEDHAFWNETRHALQDLGVSIEAKPFQKEKKPPILR